jgi:hypothetical protein
MKMLPPRPASEHLALAPSSTSGGSYLGLDPCAGLYIRTTKLVWGISIVTSILRSLNGVLSSSSSTSNLDQDSSNDYPEIGTNICGEPVEGGRLILMVAPNGDWSHNSSNSYPTIERSEVYDARTPSVGLNPDFNDIRVQAIMETIQRMTPDGSPLAALAQQEAEAADLVVAENLWREPSADNNDRARHA